jgi:magnesium-transporting ATPase (P-type)
MEIVTFVNKWIHLLSIIGAIGAIAFARLAVVPVLRSHTEEENGIGKALLKKFGILLAIYWVLILVTGFINLFLVWPQTTSAYHRLLEGKVVLALIMFALSMFLVHPAPAYERFRSNRATWLMVLLLLGILVVGLSAHLNIARVTGTGIVK